MKKYLPKPLKSMIEKYQERRRRKRLVIDYLKETTDLILSYQSIEIQNNHSNPLNKFGKKSFSQSDEDGITIEILRRINSLSNGTFAEFGVGDGTENNTLILKSLGWKGFWVGGDDLVFETKQSDENFSYFKVWVTNENIIEITKTGMSNLKTQQLDVISLDFDGNDYHFVKNLLTHGIKPKLFIVEYNAKFIPPIKWVMDYDPNHMWNVDDYFGASLASFVEMFKEFGYALVCCNAHTGCNAFFVKTDYLHLFPEIPKDISFIYSPPRYTVLKSYGHKPSLKTIAKFFK